jgi:hypothetical protein
MANKITGLIAVLWLYIEVDLLNLNWSLVLIRRADLRLIQSIIIIASTGSTQRK